MDNKFKPDALSSILKNEEKRRKRAEETAFSFKEGVTESVARIKKLFEGLERNVFVEIRGSGINVGKSYLHSTLIRQLAPLGINTSSLYDDSSNSKIKKVIFSQDTFNYKHGEEENFGANRLSDLKIGIYRPDKRFPAGDFAEGGHNPDILICNEGAKDKS